MGEQKITSTSVDETIRLAEKIGRQLRGGEIIKLAGDLGSGKTTFVRGLARGIGSRDAVRSPSFTLANEYRTPNLTIHHFDFYRLTDEDGIMGGKLTEALADPGTVAVVEWGALVKDTLPKKLLAITLRTVGPDSREVTLEYPKQFEYLIKNT